MTEDWRKRTAKSISIESLGVCQPGPRVYAEGGSYVLKLRMEMRQQWNSRIWRGSSSRYFEEIGRGGK